MIDYADSGVSAIINHVNSASWDNLPEPVKRHAEIFFADTVAVGIAGGRSPQAQRVQNAAAQWGTSDDGQLIGSARRLPVTTAAFCNAFQIHCQEFDCLHEPATVHAMAVLGGVIAALSRREELLVSDALLATVIGVDVAVGLGMAATRGLSFFRPATAGAMGTAAGLAAALKLGEEEQRNLLGLVYSQLSGTMQAHVEGSVALPLQIAATARAVVTALDLLRCGLTGPHAVINGNFGYFKLFEPDGDAEAFISDLGASSRVLELSHKPFPTGRAAHAILDALQSLRDEHQLTLDKVTSVRAEVPPLIARLVGRPSQPGMTENYARLCIAWLAPLMLRDGKIDTHSFTSERLVDPALLAWGNRIELIIDNNPDPNALGPQSVEITFKNGRVHRTAIPSTLGSPRNPLDAQGRAGKIEHCLAGEKPQRASLAEQAALLVNLKEQQPLGTLLDSLC